MDALSEASVDPEPTTTIRGHPGSFPDRPPSARGTISCFLCGGVHLFPGPRYESHLINEHGVVFDLDFIVRVSLYKQEHGVVPPVLENGLPAMETNVADGHVAVSDDVNTDTKVKLESKDSECQTDLLTGSLCSRSRMPGESATAQLDRVVSNIVCVSQGKGNLEQTNSFMPNKKMRKPFGKKWAPNSFSSTFTCYFCNEQFRKDYRLKVHLTLKHRDENANDMSKAQEELTKSKLDGCVHKCAICGSKYNSVTNFTRHIKDLHHMNRRQYREGYGCSEIVSSLFKCELCGKQVKQTRNIIGAHMKMVHLISWREYQDTLMKIRLGKTVGDLPAPELFDCIICGVSIKYKREHLNKKHQISEEIYDELIAKKNLGEDISSVLPAREFYTCLICNKECLDIKRHIERSHKISEEVYEKTVASRNDDSKQLVPDEMSNVGFSEFDNKRDDNVLALTRDLKPIKHSLEEGMMTLTPRPSSGGAVSTDLECYFGCDEYFKKDYQLYLHLRLRHSNDDPEEVKKAYEAAEEEIALTRRSASIYQCALCNRQFNDNGAFYSHIHTKHSMQWKKYKEKFGRCEIESSPFECKICNRVVKYDRNTVHTHLKHVHAINWTKYLERIRKMRRGEVPDELPVIEMTECRVCKVNVKYLRDHLKNAHKITEQQYANAFNCSDDRGVEDTSSITDNPRVKVEQDIVESQPVSSAEPQIQCPPKPPKSDIQDKANKACSGCNITFDSRRSFIEHCTTAHNMKFKTKSGVTISAPSTFKLEQAESNQPPPLFHRSLKRKSADYRPELNQSAAELEHLPVLKMAKMANIKEDAHDAMSFEDSHVGDDALQSSSQYTPIGVSKWNQCRYECCFCKKTTMSRSSMTSHIHNTHGLPIKEYKESNFPDIEVETNWFQCRLCTARTKFVKDCISPHLKMSHNMDIDGYERDFMQPEDWPQPSGPRSTLRRGRACVSTDSVSIEKFGAHTSFNPEAEEEIATGAKVDKWNKCQFRCRLCAWVSLEARSMRAHISTSHGMRYEEYVEMHGNTEVLTMRFQCLLCSSEMKHCRQNIYAHVKDVHKMSLAEYEERVSVANEIKDEMVVNKQPKEVETFGSTPEAKPTLVEKGNQSSRWNRCRFQCAICFKLSSERRQIRDHVAKVHYLSMPDYEAQHGDCEIHTEYFLCGVCHVQVKHNMKNVSLHLQNVHHMSTKEYEAQFGRLPDHEVCALEQLQLAPHQGEEEYGFGSHFLLECSAIKEPPPVKIPVPVAPPMTDVRSKGCKFCRICCKDFNRRQAFVEHCRNVHGMKVKLAGKSRANQSAIVQNTSTKKDLNKSYAGGYSCDYCGKVFSSRSNKNRHIVLACDTRKNCDVSTNCDVGNELAKNTEDKRIAPCTDSSKFE